MQSCRRTIRIVLMMIGVLAVCLWWGESSSRADEAGDLVKKIEKNLSSVQRRIVTEPSRAEKQLIETKEMLGKLKKSFPGHEKLPALQKRTDDLVKKLEKRLGRPVGGSAKPEKKKAEPEKKKAATSDLPSSVVSRLKKVGSALGAVEAALDKNQLQTATRKLKEANSLMDEIQKRYGSKIPAGNKEMADASLRLKRCVKKLSDANASAAAATAAAAALEKKIESQSREWIDKLSPFFDYDSDLYLRFGAEFNRATDEEKEKCREAYARANELMPIFQKTEFPHGKTQELKHLEQRLSGYLTIYNEEEARARQEESCREWVDRFRAYVGVGTGSRKYLVSGVTLSEEEIERRSALLEEAKALWPAYEKAEFPHGKTAQLLSLEEEMQKRFEEMPEALRRSRVLIAGDLEKEFERILNYLTADTGWKKDPSKIPNIAMERDLEPLRRALERFAGSAGAGDAKVTALQEMMTRIENQDQKNRAIRADRTCMKPDGYGGNDSDDLRQKVGEIVKAKVNGAKILRVTLPAKDWKEESVVEWTDTTHSELRHRVTRFMTAQAAAKNKDGKVYLTAVHLAKDLRTDGSFGPLYGHVIWSDWMAEKNVDQKPPAGK